jgi:predicted transcriptional regulator
MDEDVLLSKFMEINERSKTYVELMKQYPSMVENINVLYDEAIAQKKSQLDDFKLSVAQCKKDPQYLKEDMSADVKLNSELKKISKATSLLHDACLELSAYKKINK